MISSQMDGETLLVPQAEFSIEEPWAIPPACPIVALRRSTDGAQPRLRTDVAVYADAGYLNVVFSGQDDHVIATHLSHDAPLYEEDVVELFVSPLGNDVYFEIEINPLGSTFDARITSPDGVRKTMRTELDWTCEDLFAAVRKTPRSLEVLMRFPFASLGVAPPRRGDVWRGNLFRIDRGPRGDEFMAWSPTMKTPPDFHVMAAFGRLIFS